MRRGQSGIAPGYSGRGQRAFAVAEDTDREWLSSLFDAFSRNDRDLDTLVAWRTKRITRARVVSPATRVPRSAAAVPSPGRRLEDLFRKFRGSE